MKPELLEIKPHDAISAFLKWNTGDSYRIAYFEMRFQCPCAVCVDEHSGERIISRKSISPDIRVTSIRPIGRYALAIHFSDHHTTGIFDFDLLFKISVEQGIPLLETPNEI